MDGSAGDLFHIMRYAVHRNTCHISLPEDQIANASTFATRIFCTVCTFTLNLPSLSTFPPHTPNPLDPPFNLLCLLFVTIHTSFPN